MGQKAARAGGAGGSRDGHDERPTYLPTGANHTMTGALRAHTCTYADAHQQVLPNPARRHFLAVGLSPPSRSSPQGVIITDCCGRSPLLSPLVIPPPTHTRPTRDNFARGVCIKHGDCSHGHCELRRLSIRLARV